MVHYEFWELQVGQVKGAYDRKELIPDPEWQRGYIWDNQDEKLLIDSILRNIPIPKLYLTEEYDTKKGVSIHYVVDGQQRIKAIYGFLNNKYKIDFNGKECYFTDLDTKTQEKINIYKLNWHYMTDFAPTDVTFLFQRLNRTGVKLTNMEYWNSAYYRTPILALVREIYEQILGFPHKRDYRDYDESDLSKLEKSYIAIIYTDENIKRMLPLDDVIDLSNCLLKNGVESGGKRDLESFLELKKDITSAECEKVKSKFKIIMNNIKEVFPREELNDSLYNKRTHFISLFLAIGLMISDYYILREPRKLKSALLEFINDQPEEYKSSVQGGIRQKAMREQRVNYFKDIIKRNAVKLDSCQVFGEETRIWLWGNQPHKCKLCNGDIHFYYDAVVDHIIPWAKGGQTAKDNAQLAHEKCNKSKKEGSADFVYF
jgi:hypothetical protein